MSDAQPLIGITTYKSDSETSPHYPLHSLHPLFYSQGVLAGGGVPLLIPHGLDEGHLGAIFQRIDGILLAGGGDVDPIFYDEEAGDEVKGVDRERDQMEIALVRWAFKEDKPFLAICRGIQVMNVALGGSLYQDVLADMPGAIKHAYFQGLGYPRDYLAHDVRLDRTSHLAQILGGEQFAVNSLHHQGIKSLAPDLTAVGTAPDGLVEAVEVTGHAFAVGVQWHPEALAPNDVKMRCLFEGLVAAARDGIDT